MPKGSRGSSYRPSRPMKRKFYGNQFIGEKKGSQKSSVASIEDLACDYSHRYRIIKCSIVFTSLADTLCCKACKQTVKFEEAGRRGCWKLVVTCRCGSNNFIDSSPRLNGDFEVNRRMVFVMRLLGVNLEGISLFASLMDFGQEFPEKACKNIIHWVQRVVPSVTTIAENTVDVVGRVFDKGCARVLKSLGFTIGYDTAEYARKIDGVPEEYEGEAPTSTGIKVENEFFEEEEGSLLCGTADGPMIRGLSDYD